MCEFVTKSLKPRHIKPRVNEMKNTAIEYTIKVNITASSYSKVPKKILLSQ